MSAGLPVAVDLLVRVLAAGPLPGREQARDAAREELSRPEYAAAQPPLLLRVVGRVVRALGDLLDRAVARVGSGTTGRVLLALVLVALVAVVLARLGPLSRRRPALFAGAPVRTGQEHRALAERLAADGRWAEAVRERLRAAVRELEARGVLDPRPARTAGEVARDGAAVVPALRDDLEQAARTFAEVWYGGRPAGPEQYAGLVALDERVRTERLVPA